MLFTQDVYLCVFCYVSAAVIHDNLDHAPGHALLADVEDQCHHLRSLPIHRVLILGLGHEVHVTAHHHHDVGATRGLGRDLARLLGDEGQGETLHVELCSVVVFCCVVMVQVLCCDGSRVVLWQRNGTLQLLRREKNLISPGITCSLNVVVPVINSFFTMWMCWTSYLFVLFLVTTLLWDMCRWHCTLDISLTK